MALEPEQLEELGEAINNLNQVMRNLPESIVRVLGRTNALGEAFADAADGVDKYAEAQKKAKEEQERRERTIAEAEYAGISALRSFTSAVQDSGDNLKKYSGTVSSGFDFLSTVALVSGSKLGFGLSAVAKVAGVLGEQLLAYNARLVESYQTLSQFGIGTGITSEEIAKLGRASNFSGEQLITFSKTAGQAGMDLIALGGTVTDGIRMFGRFTAIGDKAARQLNYLGVSTEQYLQFQQKFLAQQISAGLTTGRGEAAMRKLTEASLEVYSEMMKVAELTGASVEKQMEEREYLAAVTNYRLYNLKRLQDIERLESTLGREEVERRKAAVKKEAEIMIENATLLSTQAGRDVARSFIARASTEGVGALSSDADVMSERLFEAFGGMTGVIREAKEAAAQGVSYQTQLQAMTYQAGARVVDILGSYTAFPQEVLDEMRGVFGGTDQILNMMARSNLENINKNSQEIEAEFNKQRQIAENGFQQRLRESQAISGATDAAMIFATTMYEAERKIRKGIDEAAGAINTPFITLGLVTTGAIAGIAALGLAAYQASKILKNLQSSIPGTGPVIDTPTRGRMRLPRGVGAGLLGIGAGLAANFAEDELRDRGHETAANVAGIAGTAAAWAGTASLFTPLLGPTAPLVIGIAGLAGGVYGLNSSIKQSTNVQQNMLDEGIPTVPSEPDVGKVDVTEGMSDQELRTQAMLINSMQQNYNMSARNQQETQQIMNAYMSRLATEEEKRNYLQQQENLARANNRQATSQDGEFTLATSRQFARSRVDLARSNEQYIASQDVAGQNLNDFSTAMRDATVKLRQISGLTILEPSDEDEKIKIDEASINSLRNAIGTAFSYTQERDDKPVTGSIDITYTPHFGDLPLDMQQTLAAIRQKESGGQIFRPQGLGNTSTIGGQYHMGQAARETAFKNLSPQEAKRLAELGFTQAPKLEQLLLNDREFKSGMKEVDDLLAKSYLRVMKAALTKNLGRTPTAADYRGAWWHGEGTYAKIVETAQTNPDMLVSEFYSQLAGGDPSKMPDVTQFKGRTVSQQLEFIRKQMANVGQIPITPASQVARQPQFGKPTDNIFDTTNINNVIAQQMQMSNVMRPAGPAAPQTAGQTTDQFDFANVTAALNSSYNRQNTELGYLRSNVLTNITRPTTNLADSNQLTANAVTGTTALTVSTSRDNPLVTVDYATSNNMTNLVDLTKIQTSELSAMNSKLSDLNSKLDTLNSTQQKLLERTTA